MTFSFACPQCGHQYELPSALAGREAKCKTCGIQMMFPAGESPSPPKSAPKPARPPLQTFGAPSAPPKSKPPLQSFGAPPTATAKRAAPQPLSTKNHAFDDDDDDPYEMAEAAMSVLLTDDDELPDPDAVPSTKRPGRVRVSEPKKRYRPAGVVKRSLASMVDGFLIAIIFLGSVFVIIPLGFWLGVIQGLFSGLLVGTLLYLGIATAFLGLFTASSLMSSPGKSLMGLKVVGHDGRRLSLARSLARALMKVAGEPVPLMGLINIFLVVFTDEGWTIYDRLCETQVVEAG
jgi:uncharacterized RDD family membrane protein YckC